MSHEAKDENGGANGHGHGKSGGRGGHGAHGGGGGHEEHEGAPEWLISFADNVTLMMGFFVILLAMTMKDAKKAGASEGAGGAGSSPPSADWLDASIAIRAAFNNPVDITSSSPHEQLLVERLRERSPGQDGEAEVEGQKGGRHNVETLRENEYYGQGGVVRFEHNANSPSPAEQTAAQELAQRLRGRRWIIEVRGHAGAAEAFEVEDRGMRLSYERAASVALILARNGIAWRQIRVVACGDNDRMKSPVQNADLDGPNRRVEVFLTDRVMGETLE